MFTHDGFPLTVKYATTAIDEAIVCLPAVKARVVSMRALEQTHAVLLIDDIIAKIYVGPESARVVFMDVKPKIPNTIGGGRGVYIDPKSFSFIKVSEAALRRNVRRNFQYAIDKIRAAYQTNDVRLLAAARILAYQNIPGPIVRKDAFDIMLTGNGALREAALMTVSACANGDAASFNIDFDLDTEPDRTFIANDRVYVCTYTGALTAGPHKEVDVLGSYTGYQDCYFMQTFDDLELLIEGFDERGELLSTGTLREPGSETFHDITFKTTFYGQTLSVAITAAELAQGVTTATGESIMTVVVHRPNSSDGTVSVFLADTPPVLDNPENDYEAFRLDSHLVLFVDGDTYSVYHQFTSNGTRYYRYDGGPVQGLTVIRKNIYRTESSTRDPIGPPGPPGSGFSGGNAAQITAHSVDGTQTPRSGAVVEDIYDTTENTTFSGTWGPGGFTRTYKENSAYTYNRQRIISSPFGVFGQAPDNAFFSSNESETSSYVATDTGDIGTLDRLRSRNADANYSVLGIRVVATERSTYELHQVIPNSVPNLTASDTSLRTMQCPGRNIREEFVSLSTNNAGAHTYSTYVRNYNDQTLAGQHAENFYSYLYEETGGDNPISPSTEIVHNIRYNDEVLLDLSKYGPVFNSVISISSWQPQVENYTRSYSQATVETGNIFEPPVFRSQTGAIKNTTNSSVYAYFNNLPPPPSRIVPLPGTPFGAVQEQFSRPTQEANEPILINILCTGVVPIHVLSSKATLWAMQSPKFMGGQYYLRVIDAGGYVIKDRVMVRNGNPKDKDFDPIAFAINLENVVDALREKLGGFSGLYVV